ncbi:MAG: D-glycero-beta-D-manno-heptose 1-phosphate adenylyltransferase [Gemmatimonadota bacterium]|nr:D-glycero-beta-D-manno-heptose 1-phosphate adenylyltransferase [Gemmatimonadota bacterium]
MKEKSESNDEKHLSLRELTRVIRAAQAEGQKVVFTNGCFDLLHPGHIHLLQSARNLGDMLVVAANSDDSIRRSKGSNRPILPEEDRVTMLAALACVDYVVIFEEDTPIPLLQALRPDVLAKGDQYSLEEVVGHEVVLGYGGRVKRVLVVEGFSTTDIVERIQNSYANREADGND